MTKVKLKPCPFCGGVAKIHKLEKHSIYTFWVECETCKVSTPTYLSKESAATKWNTREEGIDMDGNETS